MASTPPNRSTGRRRSVLVKSSERVRNSVAKKTAVTPTVSATRGAVCSRADLDMLDELVPLGRRVFDVIDPEGNGVVSSAHAIGLYARLGESDPSVSVSAWQEIVREVESVADSGALHRAPNGEVTRSRWMAWIRHLRDTTHAPFQIHDMHDELTGIVRNLRRASLVVPLGPAGASRVLVRIERECLPLANRIYAAACAASPDAAPAVLAAIVEEVTGAASIPPSIIGVGRAAFVSQLNKWLDTILDERGVDAALRALRSALTRTERRSSGGSGGGEESFSEASFSEATDVPLETFVKTAWLSVRSKGVQRVVRRRRYGLTESGTLFCHHARGEAKRHLSVSDIASAAAAEDDDCTFAVLRRLGVDEAEAGGRTREVYTCDSAEERASWLIALSDAGWRVESFGNGGEGSRVGGVKNAGEGDELGLAWTRIKRGRRRRGEGARAAVRDGCDDGCDGLAPGCALS